MRARLAGFSRCIIDVQQISRFIDRVGAHGSHGIGGLTLLFMIGKQRIAGAVSRMSCAVLYEDDALMRGSAKEHR